MVPVADFNGDGRVDFFFAATTFGDDAQVIHWVTLNVVGDPSALGLTSHNTDSGIVSGAHGSVGSWLGTGDFNNDRKLDIVTSFNFVPLSNSNPYSEAVIALSDGQGGFTSTVTVPATKTSNVSGLGLDLAVGDANSDGNLDLYVTSGGTTQIFYGDGAGSFSTTAP